MKFITNEINITKYLIVKMIQALGILHLIHGPALIILPFLYDNYKGDLLYLDYLYFMMFCYTFFTPFNLSNADIKGILSVTK